jgi:hypothetical protein
MQRHIVFALAVLFLAAATAASAEEVVETWRSLARTHMGNTVADVRDGPDKYSLDPRDGSIWWIEYDKVAHLSADGTLLFRSERLARPCRVAVDPANGSCWVLQDASDELLHFGADGGLLSATPRQYGEGGAALLTPSPADGSVWIRGESSVVHVDAAGSETFRRTLSPWEDFLQVVVDPTDGSAWLTTPTEVIRLRADGTEMWRVSDLPTPTAVDEDPRDQSFWVAVYDPSAGSYLIHISSDGTVLSEVAMEPASALCVSPTDGSVWLQHSDVSESTYGWYVSHRDSSGTEVWRLDEAALVAHNDLDGSAWLVTGPYWPALVYGTDLVHYSADHEELHRFAHNFEIDRDHVRAHDPTDNSLWMSARFWLGHRSADGTVLSGRRLSVGLKKQSRYSLDRRDGSLWVRDKDTGEYVRLSPEGVELERWNTLEGFYSVGGLQISPFDGSWWLWAVETADGEAIRLHLAEDGTELSVGDVDDIYTISYSDGSIWNWHTWSWEDERGYVYSNSVLRRYGADGTFLWESETFCGDLRVRAFAADGSAWADGSRGLLRFAPSGQVVAEIPRQGYWVLTSMDVFPHDGSIYGIGRRGHHEYRLFRMASDGSPMWVIDGLPRTGPIVVDPANGSAWVAINDDRGLGRSALVHLAADGTELWRGENFNEPEFFELDPRDGSLWLSDSGNYQVVHLDVIGDERPRFIDVPIMHWAYDEVETCVEEGIVTGYGNGFYRPDWYVTRDQMAVYVARSLEAPSGEAVLADWVPADPKDFPDVPTDHWAYTHIEYCVENGVVAGYQDGLYHPEYEVTRDQMAVYVARALVAPEGEAGLADYVPADPRDFPDVGSDFWAYVHIEYCVENGVVAGYLDGLYHPEIVVTRDQMAVYVARAFGLVG